MGQNTTLIVLIVVIVVMLFVILRLMASLRATRAEEQARLADAMKQLEESRHREEELELASTNPQPEEELEPEKPVFGHLLVIRGLDDQSITIDNEEFVLGRSEDIGINFIIKEPYISPRHCLFICKDGKFSIKDLNSKNGTFVNGERIPIESEVQVPIGSEIEVTHNIALELWDPETFPDIMARETEMTHDHDNGAKPEEEDELVFQAMPGINYTGSDDTADIGDDYSPI